MLERYLELKTLEYLLHKWGPLIKQHCPKDSKVEYQNHIFLSPENLSKKRAFQIQGVATPFVCIWPSSPLTFDTQFYSRSVLPRDLEVEGKLYRVYYYDVSLDLGLYASSYFKSFRDLVVQDILDLDRLRYLIYDIKELIPGLTTKVEFKLDSLRTRDNLDEKTQNRSFDLISAYKVRATLPYCQDFNYLNSIKVFLNDSLIYEKQGEESGS